MDNSIYIIAIQQSLSHEFKINERLYDSTQLLSKTRLIIQQCYNGSFSRDMFHYTLNELIHEGTVMVFRLHSVDRYMMHEYYNHLLAVKVLANMDAFPITKA